MTLLMAEGVLGQQPGAGGGGGGGPTTVIGPIDFETGEGYVHGDDLNDYPTVWRMQVGLTGTDIVAFTGKPQIDNGAAHTATRGAGQQVVDHSTVGESCSTHQTALSSANHWAQALVFPDSMVSATTHNAVGVLLRGQTDGTTAQSGYLCRMVRSSASGYKTTAQLVRLDANALTGYLAESADLDATYDPALWHMLRAEIDGSVITIKLAPNADPTNYTTALTYDTASDPTKYTTGTRVGFSHGRNYTASGTNAQLYADLFSAGEL